MGKVLNNTVHVLGDDGQYHIFGPEDEVPDEYAEKIGDHAWVDEPDVAPRGRQSDTDGQSYEKLTVNKLKAEIDDRNEDREPENQIVPDSQLKADLIAALEFDDAAQSD